MIRRYFQPTCIKEFRCDGSKCGAQCCRAGWAIEIDDQTAAAYSSFDAGFNQHLRFDDELNRHVIALDAEGKCPMLGEDNLCSIQKKYGEDFLSETCRQYPRQTLDFGNYFERSLSLVCPLAADLILNSERLEFEWFDADEDYHRQSEQFESNVPVELRADFVTLQRTAIAILQRRSLSIADRLIELGKYFVQLDPDIALDERFFVMSAPSDSRLLENYLVHEFFINAYPWRFPLPTEYNIKIFLSNCKELLGREPELTIEGIRQFVTVSNHDMDFIAEQLKTIAFQSTL